MTSPVSRHIDREAISRLLLDLDTVPPFALAGEVATRLEEAAGVQHASVLLSDYARLSLGRLDPMGDREPVEWMPVDGTDAGRAFRSQDAVVVPDRRGHRVFIPITVRADRIGVLEVVLPGDPDPELLVDLKLAAVSVAYVVSVALRCSDVFEHVRRRRKLDIAAEIQWSMLPLLGYESESFSVAGFLEPAYHVGGDSFDYAVNEGGLTASVTDAMGHGLKAAIFSSLAVNTRRNARRHGADALGQVQAVNDVIWGEYQGERFATALIMELHRDTRSALVVNAGHALPFRARDDRIEEIPLKADLPLGAYPDTLFRLQPLPVQPGDRLVVVSDGLLEARPDDGEQFGASRLVDLLGEHMERPPSEVVWEATRAVMEHRGAELMDDVTVLCIDWNPVAGRFPHG